MNLYLEDGDILRYRGPFLSVDADWAYYRTRGGYIDREPRGSSRLLSATAPEINITDVERMI